MKKILSRSKCIFYVFFCLFLIANSAFTVYVSLSAARGKVVDLFGKSVLMVSTGSMAPSIHEGDFILVEKTDTELLKEGDIITFYSEDREIYGKPNTHRILVKCEDGGFVTKGDANAVPDHDEVYPSQIIGKYIKKIRLFRWVNSFRSVKKLVILLVFAVSLVMSFYEIKAIRKITANSSDTEKQRLIREAIDIEKRKLYEESDKHKAEENNNESR